MYTYIYIYYIHNISLYTYMYIWFCVCTHHLEFAACAALFASQKAHTQFGMCSCVCCVITHTHMFCSSFIYVRIYTYICDCPSFFFLCYIRYMFVLWVPPRKIVHAYLVVGQGRDTWWLGTAGILGACGHCKDTWWLGAAGILGGCGHCREALGNGRGQHRLF